ncbi:hypothetical protein DMC30DRAFT_430077 [Rhodotorula diobovata]|uniref:Proteophosphoglycan ppg4 n=1 Tax=Rhodotorula diobovata TaxID=5288 RepID=A0A5C5FNW4_9BASI|nr:hypothetical protein DMC30DRAFT_430077 [Rhodotorula diobovata]
MPDAERAELERLRAEKAQQLAVAKAAQERLEKQVMTKTGENSVVRQRLSKAEAAHAQSLKAEQRDKALLQEQLEAREREYRAQLERFKMEDAFRRQELATAAGAGAGGAGGSATSQRTYHHHPNHPGVSSARSARFYAGAGGAGGSASRPGSGSASRSGSRAASAAPGPGPDPAPSPSVDRARRTRAASARATSEAPAAPAPSFAGFQSAFGPAVGGVKARGPARGVDAGGAADGEGDEREGSMGPPRKRGGRGGEGGRSEAPRTPGAPPDRKRRRGDAEEDGGARGAEGRDKGTRRLLLVEEEDFGDDEAHADFGGFEHGEPPLAREEDDDGDADAWMWVPDERDSRSELLAAVFTHTTLAPLDVEPAVVPASAHPHALRRATATAAATTSTSRFGTLARSTAASTYGGRSALAVSHGATASSAAAPTTPPGPVPTFHALMNLRFPPSTAPALVAEYELLTRELFTLLGRRLDPHGHPSSTSSSMHPSSSSTSAQAQFALLPPHLALVTPPSDLEAALLASGLARALTRLLSVLERATLVGPMTALVRLLSHLAFLSPLVAHACCAAAAGGGTTDGEGLVAVLARIVARYGRPDPPSRGHHHPSGTTTAAVLGRSASGGVMLRSRKARVARPSAAAAVRRRGGRDAPAGKGGGGGEGEGEGEGEQERVPLEAGKRARLVEGVLSVLEGVAWRCLAVRKADEGAGGGDGGRAAEEAFITFLKAPNAVATLLDPSHSVGILLGGARLLALLACRPALFRTLLATKFYEAPDVRASKLPLVDRLATLLVVPRPESVGAHTLDLTVLSLASLLLTAHEDAVMLVVQAASFVPELLAKMWRDVRTLWEWDGREASPGSAARDMLNRTTTRLSATLHLVYYLSLAPHSSLSISDLLAGPSSAAVAAAGGAGGAGAAKDAPAAAPAYARQAVNDLFMVALGTVGFATFGADEGGGEGEDKDEGEGEGGMPSWAEEGSEQRRTLCELGYMAQEILEDVSPLELEEIEVCFAPLGDGEGEDGDERMADGEDEGEDERQLAGVEEGA